MFNFKISAFLMRIDSVYKPTLSFLANNLHVLGLNEKLKYMLFLALFSILAISMFEMAIYKVFHSDIY